tara:strand:+ start:225 stop:377 length:153 start_codon:yes stop_codon:yes gene_type:complete
MSLIKTKILEDQRQQEALEEARMQLLEYVMFGGLSPIKELEGINDKLHNS